MAGGVAIIDRVPLDDGGTLPVVDGVAPKLSDAVGDSEAA